MCLIDDDDLILTIEVIRARFLKQDAIGHDFDDRVFGGLVIKSNSVSDDGAEFAADFVGNAIGDADGGDTTGLR